MINYVAPEVVTRRNEMNRERGNPIRILQTSSNQRALIPTSFHSPFMIAEDDLKRSIPSSCMMGMTSSH